MRTRSIATVVVLLAFLRAAPVIAQEHGQVGLSIGYPASVGVVWHVADRIAIRPEISLVQSSTDVTTITTLTLPAPGGAQTQTTRAQFTSDSTTVGTGVSALFYLWKWEALSGFVTPRYAYTRGTSTTTSGGLAPAEGTTRSHVVSGSFGAQYGLGRRFGVFGEIGLGYTHTNVQNVPTIIGLPVISTSSSETTSHGISTRSGAGVVFYFK